MSGAPSCPKEVAETNPDTDPADPLELFAVIDRKLVCVRVAGSSLLKVELRSTGIV